MYDSHSVPYSYTFDWISLQLLYAKYFLPNLLSFIVQEYVICYIEYFWVDVHHKNAIWLELDWFYILQISYSLFIL